jgi:hypothetical protein
VPALRRRPLVFPLLLVALAPAACTEVEDPVLDDVGATRLLLIHPALSLQSVFDPETPIQVARWRIDSARLDVAGASYDPLNGEVCTIIDTVVATPVAEGPCSGGVVVDPFEGTREMELEIELTMELRRAKPRPADADGVDAGNGDYDDDGILDDGDASTVVGDNPCEAGVTTGCDDNCLLLVNADQADADGDGIGDLCAVASTGEDLLDSDADGIPDFADNCVWIANTDQADTMGVTAEGVLDTIGDACEEQIATVTLPANLVLGPADAKQPPSRVTFVTVDFREALTCDWAATPPTCTSGEIGFCAHTTSLDALSGC